MSKINPMLVESLETITYQNNDWVIPVMSSLFEQYQKNQLDEKKLKKELDTLYMKRFGIKSDFSISTESQPNAWCAGAIIADSTTLFADDLIQLGIWRKIITEERRNLMKDIAKGDLSPLGLLDNKKVKVGGLFSKIKVGFGITRGGIKSWTPMQCTAVMLHETGHAWTFFEYLGVTVYRNAIIANTVKEVLGATSQEEKIKIVLDECNAWGLPVQPEDISKLNDEDAVAVIVGAYNNVFTHDVGYIEYNQNTCEVIADQFMARFGMAKYHAETYDNNKKDYWWGLQKSSNISTGMAIGASVAAIIGAPLVAGLTSGAFLIAGLSTLASFAIILADGRNIGEHKNGITTYDENKRRLERTYNETVGFLKNPNAPKELITKILSDLDYIKKVIDKTKVLDTWSLKLYRWLSSRYKTAEAQTAYQQMVEDMLANQLYVTAGKLKTLG